MFRLSIFLRRSSRRFPRVRGDVPTNSHSSSATRWFSPRARGCSEVAKGELTPDQVFPACAGMFLLRNRRKSLRLCFPRVRGDVPFIAQGGDGDPLFSPRARGCSSQIFLPSLFLGVFPACAGMFQHACHRAQTLRCFPRVRGDVPPGASSNVLILVFSPRARGCSLNWCPAEYP